MNDRDKKNTWSLTWIVLQLAVVFSVFSQIDPVERFFRPAMYAIWAIALVLGVFKREGKLHVDAFSERFLIAYSSFFVFCLLAGLIDSRHFNANYIRVLIVPLLVTITGGMFANEDRTLFNRLGKLYLICSVIFALWVQRTYFPSYISWLSTRIYLFQQKNSAAQIWVTAVFVSLVLVEYNNKFERILIYVACAYLLFMTGICQCRTALLGVGAAVLTYAISRAQHKARWIAAVVVGGMIAWHIPVVHQFVEQALFLNKYAGADLNTFTSGRIDHYKTAIESIWASPIIGIGKYYVDCSYLLILAESGIIGFFLIEWVWLKKLYISYSFRGKQSEQTFLFILTTFYIVESILEGYPPFGPGVSSFMYWLMSSVIVNRHISDQDS